MEKKFIKEGDEILTTELEHHSNYVPWHFKTKKGAKINSLLSMIEGKLKLMKLKNL